MENEDAVDRFASHRNIVVVEFRFFFLLLIIWLLHSWPLNICFHLVHFVCFSFVRCI